MTETEYVAEQKRLNTLLLKKGTFEEGMSVCKSQNAVLHESAANSTFMDELVCNLDEDVFAFRPPNEFESIAWVVWHITRIEDAVGNILIANTDQIFNENWKIKIGTEITDTANAFTKEVVDYFSCRINMKSLFEYRRMVGKRTQELLKTVQQNQLKTKPTAQSIDRLLLEGVLTNEKESLWLKDFWAHKTIKGLLLLPITRHQMMHIPHCIRLKNTMNEAKAEKENIK